MSPWGLLGSVADRRQREFDLLGCELLELQLVGHALSGERRHVRVLLRLLSRFGVPLGAGVVGAERGGVRGVALELELADEAGPREPAEAQVLLGLGGGVRLLDRELG